MAPTAKRLLLWTLPAILLVVGLAVAFRPRPLPVDMAEVRLAALQVTVTAEGMTRVRDVYRVSAPVGGEVQRLPLNVGDAVVGGETLVAALRPAFAGFLDQRARAEAEASFGAGRASEAQAQAELQRAEAEVAFARGELTRIQRLAADGTVARRALDRAVADARAAEAAVEVARASLEARRSEVEVARARLMQPTAGDAPQTDCCVEVRAPVSGQILVVHQRSQAVVTAGAPLADVGDPASLEVVADFLSTDAVRIAPGMPAILRDWGGPPLDAVVRRVEPAAFTKVSALGIEEQRVNVVLDFSAPIPAQLGHAFRVMVDVVVWQADQILSVPLGALFRDGSDWAVFRVEAGTARLRPISLGRMTSERAQVLDGLNAGDRVVLYPSDLVADGTAVELSDSAIGGR
ncbi:MAG: HlyD family efflux transporter periplasmic adaptor subunit [Rhodospirillaceae bacterium]